MSHRGGKPGFVGVTGDTLAIPDFRGNRFYNTLGNLLGDPRAGLLFIDFASGDILQLQGRATIDWHPEGNGPAGAERLWRVDDHARLAAARRLSLRLALRRLRADDPGDRYLVRLQEGRRCPWTIRPPLPTVCAWGPLHCAGVWAAPSGWPSGAIAPSSPTPYAFAAPSGRTRKPCSTCAPASSRAMTMTACPRSPRR